VPYKCKPKAITARKKIPEILYKCADKLRKRLSFIEYLRIVSISPSLIG